VEARAELNVGFGAVNEGGVVGRDVREEIVKLERELGVWKKGVGEALKDAREAERAMK
jgi:SET and MYND domain-containing protein